MAHFVKVTLEHHLNRRYHAVNHGRGVASPKPNTGSSTSDSVIRSRAANASDYRWKSRT